MHFSLPSVFFAIGLLAGMMLLLELGRRLGRHRLGRNEDGARAGFGVVEGAVFTLMGLLVAFTFSSASARFEQRRQLIVEEANAIGTAWLRLDLLPAASQPELRDLFRQYLDSRLAIYQKVPDWEAVRAEQARATALQGQIWARATTACKESPNLLPVQLIPALNQMFDISSARLAAVRIHQPLVIFFMLGVLVLMSSLLAGYAMAGAKTRSWMHMLGLALIMAATVYIILDLEFPRLGFIRVDNLDQLLVELRQGMK